MRPIHRADLRQDDSPPFWGKEWQDDALKGRWLAQVIRCQDGEQRSEQIDSLRWPPRPLASDAMRVDLKLPLNSHALPSFSRLVSHPAGRLSAPC
jgi:hypothetical protein